MGSTKIKFKQLSKTFKIWPLFVSAASSLILLTLNQSTTHAIIFAVPLTCKSVSFLCPLLRMTLQPRVLSFLPTQCICKLLFQDSLHLIYYKNKKNTEKFFFFYNSLSWQFSNISVQFSSVAQLYLTLCNPMDYSMPGFPVHHQLVEPAQTHVHGIVESVMLSNHHILCHPLLLLPSVFHSIRVFSSESVLHIR